jgi:uncharacterized damage-inducible protein DinB
MPETREALLQHYRDMREQLLAAIDRLSDEMLAERSLDGWSVKDHLTHLALWDGERAAEVERISAGHDSIWPRTGDHNEAFSALGHDLYLDVSAEQAKWELASSHRRLLDAIAAATERGLDFDLYGEAGLHSTHEAVHTFWIKRWRSERAS